MPSDAPSGEFTPQKRLHGLSWIFVAVDYIRHFIVPLIAAVVLGAQDDYALWGLVLVVPLVIGAVWQQWIYRYDFGPSGLVIHEGLFFRNVRNIDYGRIENVDTERNLLHRLFDVAQVRVETSSGGRSEAVIRVLGLPAVKEMRERIFSARDDVATADENHEPDVAETLLHLGLGELVRYGLIDNRGVIVVAALFGLLAQGGMYQAMEDWLAPLIEQLPFADFAAIGPLAQAFFILSTIAGLVAGTRLLSILIAFITLHDFRLTRNDEDLRVHHGLFTRLALTMRRPRIQVVHQKASLLHRLFKRVSLRVDLAGGMAASNGQNAQQGQTRKLWLAPVATPEKAGELIRIALPGVHLEGLDWQQLSPRAQWRLFRLLSGIWLVISAAPAIFFLGWWAPAIVLPVMPLLWLYARMYVKYTRWALHDDFFVFRRGWLTRRLSIAPRNRIQSVRVSESPFDRRYRMAGLGVDTAGASAGQIRIPFLDRDAARMLAHALYAPKFQRGAL
ncbi:MAG TPA: PH domain-containing protein [Gammaproteobacteria bacterium]